MTMNMAVVCKSCDKQLYKSDGSGPFACPSCVLYRIEAKDSETGEPVELSLNGKPSPKAKSPQTVMLNLIKDTRFQPVLPARQEFPDMLKLHSKHFRGAETLNGVLCKFDKDGNAAVAKHNKQFIEEWMHLMPNRVFWVEEPKEALPPVPVKEVIPEVVLPPVTRGRPKKKG